MRRRVICLAVLGVLSVFAAVALATVGDPVGISKPVAGGGTDGYDNCTPGTYATNRSESALAADRTGRLLGLSKYFFGSSYGGQIVDWSQVYRFQLGSYEGVDNALLPGYDCITAPPVGLPGWDVDTDPNIAFDYAGNAYSAALGFNYDNSDNVLAVSKKSPGGPWQPPVVLKQFKGNAGIGREYDKQWITADWNRGAGTPRPSSANLTG